MARPNVGDRFAFGEDVTVEPSSVVHAKLTGAPHHSGITVWTKLATISPIPYGGTYRVVMSCSKVLSSPGVFEFQVRKNGDPIGDILESNSSEQHSIVNTSTQDLQFATDDEVQLWGSYPEGWIMRINEFSVGSSLAMTAVDHDPDPT